MNNEKIKVSEGPTLRSGVLTVVGAITVGVLAKKGNIPHHNPTSKKGYQRPATPKRVSELAEDLRKNRVDIPTAILISVREKPDKVLDTRGGMRLLDLSEVKKVYIVDGQHRYNAIKQVVDDEETTFPLTYKLPFVCMIGATEEQEMEQFHVVNSTSKSVSTGLAYDLLARRHQSNDSIREALVERGKEWQLDGQKLLEALNERSPIWRGRIKFVGARKEDNVNAMIPSASMVTSFKSIFNQSALFMGIGDVNKQAQVLDAYWNGIKGVLPMAFENPRKYSLQKGVGVRVMHGIFPDVLERVRESGSYFDPKPYSEVLNAPLLEMYGQTGTGGTVYGAEFWLTGQGEGAAWNFSNGAGIRILISRMQQELPPIKIR